MTNPLSRSELEERVRNELSGGDDPVQQILWCSVDLPGSLPKEGVLARTETLLVFVDSDAWSERERWTWTIAELSDIRQEETLHGVRLVIGVSDGVLGVEGFPEDVDATRLAAGLRACESIPSRRQKPPAARSNHPRPDEPVPVEPTPAEPTTIDLLPAPPELSAEKERVRLVLVGAALVALVLAGLLQLIFHLSSPAPLPEAPEPAAEVPALDPPAQAPPEAAPVQEPSPAEEAVPAETAHQTAHRMVAENVRVRACFSDAVTDGEISPGTYMVRIHVQPDGWVWAARLEDQDLWGTDLARCVQAEISPMVLPPPAIGSTEFLFVPFVIR